MDASDQPIPPQHEMRRLWTPWRMRYIGGGTGEEGCIFCNRLAATDDVASLVLFRSKHVFGIMNLFPYNTGHLMLVPNAHVATPETADPEALAEIGTLLGPTLRALRRALGCHGFNVGFNVGAVAGAGLIDHAHQHVVPRWTGDANFMPVLASTKVLPELIPVTYAKVRAELRRELTPSFAESGSVRVVLLTPDAGHVVVVSDGVRLQLPRASPAPDEPVWQAAFRAIAEIPGDKEIAGWAGPVRADDPSAPALGLRLLDALLTTPAGWHALPIGEAAALADSTDRAAVAELLRPE